MSVRRMTSYRLFLLRGALGRFGRAVAYHGVSLRGQVRTWRSSYPVTLVGYWARTAATATARLLRSLPRRLVAVLGLVAWFVRSLPPYAARVIADRREDRAELRAERRLLAAERRARSTERRERRQAEQAAIKAGRTERPYLLPVPAWISRMERPQRPAGTRSIPVPRRAVVAAVLTVAAVVPAYAVVGGALSSDGPSVGRAVAPAGGAGAPGTPAAAPGSTGAFVAGLPALPTAAPSMPRPQAGVAAPNSGPAVSSSRPLSLHQQRVARRQAKYEAAIARGENPVQQADAGK